MTVRLFLEQLITFLRRLVRFEIVRGEPFVVQGRRLIPVSRVLRIAGSGSSGGGGLVWNRPVALIEEIVEGIYQHHHIRDVTWQTIAVILLSAVAFRAMLTLLFRRRA
jgi:hypothetical protein